MPAPTKQRKEPKGTEALPKDDIELRLEKALFGDDAGFLESLKATQVQEDRSLSRIRDEDDEGEEAFDEGLTGVADEDVRIPPGPCGL